jgi:hypothetical protein
VSTTRSSTCAKCRSYVMAQMQKPVPHLLWDVLPFLSSEGTGQLLFGNTSNADRFVVTVSVGCQTPSSISV